VVPNQKLSLINCTHCSQIKILTDVLSEDVLSIDDVDETTLREDNLLNVSGNNLNVMMIKINNPNIK
jgi:hypothetical protein